MWFFDLNVSLKDNFTEIPLFVSVCVCVCVLLQFMFLGVIKVLELESENLFLSLFMDNRGILIN